MCHVSRDGLGKVDRRVVVAEFLASKVEYGLPLIFEVEEVPNVPPVQRVPAPFPFRGGRCLIV